MTKRIWLKADGGSAILSEWAHDQIYPGEPWDGFPKGPALAVLGDDGHLRGCIICHDHDKRSGTMNITVAGVDRNWLTRNVWCDIFEYAFNEVGCQMVIARTTTLEKHDVVRRIGRALGATETIIKRFGGRDKDGVLITLTDDQWEKSRFRRARHGRSF